jgi:hypothetical protein
MSNPVIDQLLRHYASKGLTVDRLASMSEDDLASLAGEDGLPLSSNMRIALRAAVRQNISSQPASFSRPGTAYFESSATASSKTLAENEALKARLAELERGAALPQPSVTASSKTRAENDALRARLAELERSGARPPALPYPSVTASSKTRAENDALRAELAELERLRARPHTSLPDPSATASSKTRAENEVLKAKLAELERLRARPPALPHPSATASSKTRAENEALKAELARVRAMPPVVHAPLDVTSSRTRRELIALKERNDKLEREASRMKHDAKVKISEVLSCTRDRLAVALRHVQQIVNDLVRLGSSLDICFCMDGTGSMASTISSVKLCIVEVAQRIAASTGMTCRFALVVYRDYSDEDLRLQTWDFKDSSALERALGTVTATGGGDEPEDCFGGLMAAATRVSWRAPSKVIVWMGDAPQHGEQYNGGCADDYPEGDPDGVTSSTIFDKLKRTGIILVFSKLTEYTNAMMAQLRFEVAPFGDSLLLEYNIGGPMSGFLTSTLHSTAARTYGSRKAGTEKPHVITPANWSVRPPLWGTEELCRILTFQPYVGGELHPLLDLLSDGADVKARDAKVFITRNPVDKGENRLAYYCRIIEGSGGWLDIRKSQKDGVVKESRYEGTHNTKRVLAAQAHIQSVAAFLALEFTSKCALLGISKVVKYVSVELVQIPSRPRDKQYFSLEPFITGTYLKFNNNNGYVNKPLEAAHAILQTFSHFTYCYSRGLVMVTDIQGAVHGDTYLLTDPAIHTPNPDKDLPDPTNMGLGGMGAFFATHSCNGYCRRLSLKLPADLDTSAPFDALTDPSSKYSCYDEDDWTAHSV